MTRGMKGQAVFEFIIASLILFSVIIYTINVVSSDFNLRHNHFLSDRLEGNVIRVSDLLLSEHQYGLTGDWPRLDQSKLDAFEAFCNPPNDYTAVLEAFGLKEVAPYTRYTHMNVTVLDSDDVYVVNCGRTPPETVGKAVITRFAFYPSNDEIARIDVTLW